jgi:hypothetical protein
MGRGREGGREDQQQQAPTLPTRQCMEQGCQPNMEGLLAAGDSAVMLHIKSQLLRPPSPKLPSS